MEAGEAFKKVGETPMEVKEASKKVRQTPMGASEISESSKTPHLWEGRTSFLPDRKKSIEFSKKNEDIFE